MKFDYRLRFPFGAVAAALILAFAVGCGGDSGLGPPVYSGSSIYLEDRDGQPVVVFEISISDSKGDPYTKGLLVENTAFTPDSSFSVLEANQGGKITIILDVSTPGDYRIAIESFRDSEGKVLPPAPDSTELGGKVLLTYNYAP
jgi:hypothetical protein